MEQTSIAYRDRVTATVPFGALRPGAVPPLPAVGAAEGEDGHGMSAVLALQLGVYSRAAQAALAERAGLPQADFSALEYISAFDGLAAGQLAQLLGMSYGGTAAMADRLERAGYITRERHALDRRVVLLRPVTGRCNEVLKNRSRAVAELNRHLLEHYGADAVRLLQDMLGDCMEVFRHEAAHWLKLQENDAG